MFPVHRPSRPSCLSCPNTSIGRRQFVRSTLALAAGCVCPSLWGASRSGAVASRWSLGCFNRPWYRWSFDEALDAIQAAGFTRMGLLGGHAGDPLIGPGATPEYLVALRQRIAARGLVAISGAFRVNYARQPLDEALAYTRERIENAHALGLSYLLTADEPNPQYYKLNVQVMASAAAWAQERGMKLVFKPHGTDAPTLRQLLRDVGHPNFKIWYDAGNILYYTGQDPLAELDPLMEHITGFCAKDCPGLKGDGMIQFGEGKVDFRTLFERFQRAGFRGPVMVETCRAGATSAETTSNVEANRRFLEKLLANT